MKDIAFPPKFDIESTPLVTFRRIDLLFSKAELNALYHIQHPYFSLNDTLFSQEAVWTMSVHEYLDIFLSPLPKANYGTMIVSTAGHWTTTMFSYFLDDEKKDSGTGIDDVLDFFEYAMEGWAAEVQMALWKDQKRFGTKMIRNRKKVVVRAYLPGHEDCHNHREAWTEVQPFVWNWYNWGNIWDFNARFQVSHGGHPGYLCSYLAAQRILSSRKKFPNIYFLPIDHPARLRPDAVSSYFL